MAYLEGLSFTQIAGQTPLRRVLPNGLEVLYTHRPGIGLCTVQAWVRTGSAQEGKWEGSGISHYLEHMVFKSTARFGNGELTEAIHRAGGNSNAYTTFDRTVYYIDAPEEGFATAMEAISEMVFNPLLKADDAKLERDVILREIAMRDDEHDSIFAEKILEETLHTHPMRHPIIGHKDLFIKITPDDLRAYHSGRYSPENVVLAMGGSMEPDEVFKAAELWFGRFSRTPVIQEIPVVEPPIAQARRVEVARDVSICKGVATWRIPGFFAKDRSAIDLFLGVLGSGNSSTLWEDLRENKKLVHSIDAHAMGLKDIGLAWLSWIGDAKANHKLIEKTILERITDLQDKGVSVDQFEKVRRQAVVSMVNGLKTIHSATARTGYAACIGYDYAWPTRGVEELAQLTPEVLTQVGRTWLTPDSVTLGVMNAKASLAVAQKTSQTKTPDSFEVITLENGVRVVLQEDHSVPKAGFGVYFSAGIAYESDEKRGATGILSTLLTRDTVKHSRQEVAQIVDRLGATFADVGSQLSCGLWGEALSSDFEQIAELVKNGVLTPKLLNDAFESEKASAIAACKEAADDLVEKGRLRLLKQFFGNHPLSIDASGTPETLEKLKQSDVIELHQHLVVPANLVIGVSGSFDRRVALDFIKKYFGTLPKS
jgi:zinc protease